MTDEQTLINAVRSLASARTQIDCAWVDVNDCMLDGDILEFLSDSDFDFSKTMKAIEQWIHRPVSSTHNREYDPDNYRGI